MIVKRYQRFCASNNFWFVWPIDIKILKPDIQDATFRHLEGRKPITAARSFAAWQSFSLGIFLGLALAGIIYFQSEALTIASNILFAIFFLILGLKVIIFIAELFFSFKACLSIRIF